MVHRKTEEVDDLFNTSVNPNGGGKVPEVKKAPGISESGAEPLDAGYRLGSPPSAQPKRAPRRYDDDGEVVKHDTPRSPHRVHGPKAKSTENLDRMVSRFVEIASGPYDMHEGLERAWREYPEEARHLKEDAMASLDEMFPDKDTVTVFHATWSDFVDEGSFNRGFDPFTSFSLSEEAANQVADDFGIDEPVVMRLEVPKRAVATLYSSHPSFEQEGMPADHQEEILFDKRVPMNLMRGVRRINKDIGGAGSPTDSADVHTDAAGGDKKRPRESQTYGVAGR